MTQPVGYDYSSDKVCRLRRSLYGLKQSPRRWNKRFKISLMKFDFKSCNSYPCVFTGNISGNLVILTLYVDDGLIVIEKKGDIESLLNYLKGEFEITISELKAVGSLIFLTVGTKPYIGFAVSYVSRYLDSPCRSHIIAVKRIFKYLVGTKSYGINFKKVNEMKIDVYSDADYAGDPNPNVSLSTTESVRRGMRIREGTRLDEKQ